MDGTEVTPRYCSESPTSTISSFEGTTPDFERSLVIRSSEICDRKV